MKVKVRVCECPKCRYRWRPRVKSPKECPECKHRFGSIWGFEVQCRTVEVKSREEFRKLKEDIEKWNATEVLK